MFKFEIAKNLPKFIMNDKNGYACAMAIQAGIQALNDGIEDGVKCITDVASMPEWRLDELAEEYGIIYDYNADIDVKRGWIRDAVSIYSRMGTPAIIVKYLKAAYDSVVLEEWWEYGGDPYHFRITVDGEWSAENEAWVQMVIGQAKNERSVLDNVTYSSSDSEADLNIGAAYLSREIVVSSVSV